MSASGLVSPPPDDPVVFAFVGNASLEAAVPLLPAQAQVVDLPRFAEVLRYYDWSPEDVGEDVGHLRDFLF